jgi:hypothetical protein
MGVRTCYDVDFVDVTGAILGRRRAGQTTALVVRNLLIGLHVCQIRHGSKPAFAFPLEGKYSVASATSCCSALRYADPSAEIVERLGQGSTLVRPTCVGVAALVSV